MTEWEPIETAPKDGTAILVCGRYPHYRKELAIIRIQWWDTQTDKWANVSDPIIPTHWMPLPDLPEEKSEGI